VATDKETPELWHQRLGHTGIRGLISLVKHRAIHGIKLPAHTLAKLRGKHCQVCIMSKHNRSPFHPRQERADTPMAVLHSDICGPYPIRSIGGGIYVLTLVDEYSGFCAVSILKNLKNAHEELKRMILEWEAKTGRLCKKLFSDRGGSYIKDDLAKWCAEKHIEHEFSAPRTPEQNGKAERLNQTLNNIMRSLLFQYNCYVPLWSHAMIYAALIHNVSYSQRLDMSRHQAFLGDVPDVSMLRKDLESGLRPTLQVAATMWTPPVSLPQPRVGGTHHGCGRIALDPGQLERETHVQGPMGNLHLRGHSLWPGTCRA
jgi:transposase InsO family protein